MLARAFIGLLLAAALAAPLWMRARTPLIHARMADSGGWSPLVLHARVGQPLHLRLTSDDVMHGFAVGQTEMQPLDVQPGKVTEVSLRFSQPGSYTFYCTRWCGLNHWRMRGTIEVTGDGPAPREAAGPLYVRLGLDLDAPHEAPVTPERAPVLQAGRQLAAGTDLSAFLRPEFQKAHSPYETWRELRGDPELAARSDAQLWDLVAFVWSASTTPEAVQEGRQLFAQNCAACHGSGGRGDGVFAATLAANGAAGGVNMMVQRPANLADPARMLGASPALLEGKIMRGGMGTGMPSWGSIFSQAQVESLISFLYSLQFKEFNP